MLEDSLRLIVLESSRELGGKVNSCINKLRNDNNNYIVPIQEIRFSNGEGKVVLGETIRDKNVYILADIGNHSCTYKLYGYDNHKSPDDHFQDIKRVISAIKGHASNVNVVMPLLYEARQHKRKGRESLDCAVALQELEDLGVNSIITFDVHDPNVQNAIPCMPFENFYATCSMLKDFGKNENIDYCNLMVISPDTGAMDRARYYADILKCDVGMFYKRRDLSVIVNGKNPITTHEYMGKDVEGKTVIVVDDMIDSGKSILEVVKELNKRKVKKVYMFATFSLFSEGIKEFNEYYERGMFNKLYSTNLTYVINDAKNAKWFHQVDCSPYLGAIIDTLDKHQSISPLMDGREKVFSKVHKYIPKEK